MNLLISDANILIDLEEGRLIESMFRLPCRFSIPDILFAEELGAQHHYMLELGLARHELDGHAMFEAVNRVGELARRYNGPSRNDFFALVVAEREQCALLTGDKALKNAAETESVMVHGTLWLVEMMIREELIITNEAREAYARMRETGRRLPWRLAETRLQELDSGHL